jgi:hypothetical protein
MVALAVSGGVPGVRLYHRSQHLRARPEGIKISAFFIAATVITSLISRAMRSIELRIRSVELNERAAAMLAEDEDRVIRLIARRPRVESEEAFDLVEHEVRRFHSLSP